MTRPRDIALRLALYDDLSGILNAMRSFALAELRRVGRHEAAQHAAGATLDQALADVAPALPQPPAHGHRDLWVLLGSVRGFCGSYNEDVARHFRRRRAAIGAAIVVGERLGTLLAEADDVVRVAGAVGAADAADTIERIVRAMDDARARPDATQGLVLCWRDEGGVVEWRILPIAVPARPAANRPVTYAPLPQVAAGVARHYVFHRLLSGLVGALRVENQMRLLLMENAMRHIERKREDLQRSRNQLRQEEIIEDIELVGQRRPSAESEP